MLYYQDKGEGKTIVFLHGFLENLKTWDFFQEKLSQKYRVITIDLPGHGKSSEQTEEVNRMESIAEQVNEVLEHLKIEKIILIGHSMGGYVSLSFADLYKYKIEGLGLFYSTTLPDDENKKEQRLKAAEVAVKNPKEFFKLAIPNLFAQQNLSHLEPEIKTAISWAEEASLKGISASLKGMRLRQDRSSVIKNLEKPVFVITGTYDNAVKNVELRKSLEGAGNVTFYELPTGHMGALEKPEECLQIIQNWLENNFK